MAQFHEVLSENAAARQSRGKKPKLATIELARAENGGHVATHRFTSEGPSYQEPKQHVFGADEGHKLIAHLKEHMGIQTGEKEPEGESQAVAAE